MQYGHFDDLNKEYVISTPATPLPWINYLGSQEFFSLISNTAGGYCFYRDAKLQRLLRYRYNAVPGDNGGRFYYIKETGNHVMYRVTPIYNGLDYVAQGVLMEAYSVEDDGKGVCFNVYVYNAQPGITIDYETGDSRITEND